MNFAYAASLPSTGARPSDEELIMPSVQGSSIRRFRVHTTADAGEAAAEAAEMEFNDTADLEVDDALLPSSSYPAAPIAPTALLLLSQSHIRSSQVPSPAQDDDSLLTAADLAIPAPTAAASQQHPQSNVRHPASRRIAIPPNRLAPLRSAWPQMYPPLCEQLLLQVRVRNRTVEMRASRLTPNPQESLQKGEDFVRAVVMGFEVADAVALLRLDDMYIEAFEIKDIRTLQGDALARAIGRIAGTGGKMKHAIENTTTTRIVLSGQKIHILGRFREIRMARETIVNLVLGSRPGKVHQQLRTIASRRKERF